MSESLPSHHPNRNQKDAHRENHIEPANQAERAQRARLRLARPIDGRRDAHAALPVPLHVTTQYPTSPWLALAADRKVSGASPDATTASGLFLFQPPFFAAPSCATPLAPAGPAGKPSSEAVIRRPGKWRSALEDAGNSFDSAAWSGSPLREPLLTATRGGWGNGMVYAVKSFNGDVSSVGRALDCDSRGHGFDSRTSPQLCEIARVVQGRGLQNRRAPVRIWHLTLDFLSP